MAKVMTAEERLKEWGRARHYEGWTAWPDSTVLSRIREEGAGASHRTDEQSDGGAMALCIRLGWVAEKERRCRQVGEAILVMQREAPDHYDVLDATYVCQSSRDCPRSSRAAARVMGIARNTYRKRKAAMIEWMAVQLGLGLAGAQMAPESRCDCTDRVVCEPCRLSWSQRPQAAVLEVAEPDEPRAWPSRLSLKPTGTAGC